MYQKHFKTSHYFTFSSNILHILSMEVARGHWPQTPGDRLLSTCFPVPCKYLFVPTLFKCLWSANIAVGIIVSTTLKCSYEIVVPVNNGQSALTMQIPGTFELERVQYPVCVRIKISTFFFLQICFRKYQLPKQLVNG